MVLFGLASKVFRFPPNQQEFRQAPYTHHPETRHASQGLVPRCPTLNHQQHIPQAWKGQTNAPSKPSDAGDHGHSKPVYLLPSSVRKPTAPERVVARHRRCFEATTVSDHRSLASGAVGYASNLLSIPVCRKSVGSVALTSQYRQGTRKGSKQKKKSAVRRCRVQSEVVTIGRHLRVRPHHHAQTILPSSG